MDPRVRDLYKRILYVGRDYPLGLDYVRNKAKEAFYLNQFITDPAELNRSINKGRWMAKEMIGVIQLKKYRTLNSRYTSEDLREALRRLDRTAHP